MSESRHHDAGPHGAGGEQPLDRDLRFRGIAWFTAGLVALVAVTGVLMYLLVGWLEGREIAKDPPPPVLPEARAPHLPPAPRLQADPLTELRDLRAAEEGELASWGWVDEAAGIARIPVERAMELLVEHGLPAPEVVASEGAAEGAVGEADLSPSASPDVGPGPSQSAGAGEPPAEGPRR